MNFNCLQMLKFALEWIMILKDYERIIQLDATTKQKSNLHDVMIFTNHTKYTWRQNIRFYINLIIIQFHYNTTNQRFIQTNYIECLKRQRFNVFIRSITLKVTVSESFDITIETTDVESIFKYKTLFHNLPSVRCLSY